MRSFKEYWILILALASTAVLASCSSVHSVFVGDGDKDVVQSPIRNPFNNAIYGGAYGSASGPQATVLRSKQGDRTIELELPNRIDDNTDFVVPLSAPFEKGGRSPASASAQSGTVDDSYLQRKPSMADREITSTFPQGAFEDRGRRQDIEQGLGLIPADDPTPTNDQSYLAGVDRIKQLYRLGRFEAALLETDDMIRNYQTDAHLYEMRGTLLDRIGKRELAIKSWNQALRFDPANARLRRFVDRKQRLASEASSTGLRAAHETRAPASQPADEDSADTAPPGQRGATDESETAQPEKHSEGDSHR